MSDDPPSLPSYRMTCTPHNARPTVTTTLAATTTPAYESRRTCASARYASAARRAYVPMWYRNATTPSSRNGSVADPRAVASRLNCVAAITAAGAGATPGFSTRGASACVIRNIARYQPEIAWKLSFHAPGRTFFMPIVAPVTICTADEVSRAHAAIGW